MITPKQIDKLKRRLPKSWEDAAGLLRDKKQIHWPIRKKFGKNGRVGLKNEKMRWF